MCNDEQAFPPPPDGAAGSAPVAFQAWPLSGFQILLRDYLGREGGEDWVRPALCKEIYRDALLLLPLGLCKAGRALFLSSKLEGATCFAQSGVHFGHWALSPTNVER